MRAMMVRSIPLALDTRDAWKSAGAVFARRTSDDDRIQNIAYDAPIINLGSSQCMIEGIWNEARVVEPLLTPIDSRSLLGSLMPSGRYEGPAQYCLRVQVEAVPTSRGYSFVTYKSTMHCRSVQHGWKVTYNYT